MARLSANGRPWRRLVAQLKATNRICWLCGHWINADLPARHPMSFTADHVVPRSLGGPDTLGNLRPAHRACNSRKGNRPIRSPLRTSRAW